MRQHNDLTGTKRWEDIVHNTTMPMTTLPVTEKEQRKKMLSMHKKIEDLQSKKRM